MSSKEQPPLPYFLCPKCDEPLDEVWEFVDRSDECSGDREHFLEEFLHCIICDYTYDYDEVNGASGL